MGVKLILYHSPNKNEPPTIFLLDLDKSITISENDFVFFELVSDQPLPSNCYLWLSDFKFTAIFSYRFETSYHYNINLGDFFNYEDIIKFSYRFAINGQLTLFYKIFLNYYGECAIELEGVSEKLIQLGKVNVESHKISNINFLLDYLLEKNHFYWNTVSLTKIEAIDLPKDQENIIWTLKKIEKSLNVLEQNFIPHIKDAIGRLVPHFSVGVYNESSIVTEESLLWLLENPDALENTHQQGERNILLLNRPYRLNELLTQELILDTDVLENQVIHGFLIDISIFLNSSSNSINKVLDALSLHADFKSQIYRSYYSRLRNTINSLYNSLYYVNAQLNKFLPVSRMHLSFSDDSKFNSKQHYHDVYIEISKWIYRSDAIFSIDELFSGAKDIAKLYEIYCLFKSIDTLTCDLGFEMTNQSRPVNDLHEYELPDKRETAIHTYHSFKRDTDDIVINLFYEALPESLTTVAKGTVRGFRPDFVLEITQRAKVPKYLILDAKYKKIDNIRSYDYQELSLKYLHGIGLREGGYLPVVGLFILNPIVDTAIDYYQKSVYTNSSSLVLPLIGRVEVSIGSEQTNYLKDIFSKMIEIYKSS